MTEELNTPEFPSVPEVVQLLTETQKKTLDRFRTEGTKDFTRNDYKVLATVRKQCRYIIENYEEAKRIYLELTK